MKSESADPLTGNPEKIPDVLTERFNSPPAAGIVSTMSAMLRSLRIRNLALVEELEWEIPPGFTAVTGETGAGKSVIIGALKFLLGERADRGAVRSGASSAGIEAVFFLEETSEIDALLEESGVDACQEGELILKRSIAAEGAGRQFINGSPCNLSVLKELGALLVDLHGPHDHQSLFSRSAQTMLLDRYAEALPLRETYMRCRTEWNAAKRELQELENGDAGEHRLARLREEVAEISAAGLQPGEEEALAIRYRAASNSRRLIELCSAAANRLDGEDHGATHDIAEAVRMLRDLSRLDDRGVSHLDSLEKIASDLDSLVSALRDHAESIEVDAGELLALEERMNLLATLRRKYGPSLENVIARGEDAARELERLSGLDEFRAAAKLRHDEAFARLEKASDQLGKARRESSGKLSARVRAELSDLGFRQAGFEITLDDVGEPGPEGPLLAEFLFAPNPGEPAQPLRSIASSGEISRVMLALKSALAGQDRIPLLVFDEIDANVGGEIATRVAGKMRELGTGHQVLCITHLPQVAAAASSQFLVIKSVADGRTGTRLEPVVGDDRVSEIARMLGGVTDSARIHAATLLKESRSNPTKSSSGTRGKRTPST